MPWIDSIHGILLSFADQCLSRAPGPGLHLADMQVEGEGAEAQLAPERLQRAERLRRVVAEPVEDVREREVRPRAGPALPGEAGALDRGAERRRREVEEVLARLVVVPARAEDARLVPADVRRHQVQEAARHEQPLDLAERRDRVGEVFDRVVQRDHVEPARRKAQLLEEARVHDRAASARARRGVAGDLHALGLPARRLRLEDEVAERGADVEETAAPSVALLDRGEAALEGAAVHVGVEEVVRVAALRVVRRVVRGVVEVARRSRTRVLAHEFAGRARDDERAVDPEERARAMGAAGTGVPTGREAPAGAPRGATRGAVIAAAAATSAARAAAPARGA